MTILLVFIHCVCALIIFPVVKSAGAEGLNNNLTCESKIPSLPNCVIQLTRKTHENGTEFERGLEGCHSLTENSVVVAINQLVDHVSFVCTSNSVLEVRISFEHDATIAQYTNVRRRRLSSNYKDAHAYKHQLSIEIPATPRILGASKQTTLVKYGIYNPMNVGNNTNFVNVLLYALEYNWNNTFNQEVHWMTETTTILAIDEVILIPCLTQFGGNISVLRYFLNSETNSIKLGKLEQNSLTYDPLHGFWMNTTRVANFPGTYVCTVIHPIETSAEISKEKWNNIYASKSVIFSVELPPELYVDPNQQLLLADEQFTTDKVYNLQMKAEPFSLICSSTNGPVEIIVDHVVRSGNLFVNLSTHETLRPEKRFFATALLTYVSQDDCIKSSLGEDCLHDYLQIKCSNATNADAKGLKFWEVRTRQQYTEDEYEYGFQVLEWRPLDQNFVCVTSYDNTIQHSVCSSMFQCHMLRRCLQNDTKSTGQPQNCINSVTTLAKSSCKKFEISSHEEEKKYFSGQFGLKTCHVAKPLSSSKGIIQCTTTKSMTSGIEQYRIHYFVGFNGLMYGDTRRAPSNATLKLKPFYHGGIYYTEGNFEFRCEAQSFFFEEGIVWLHEYKNGSQIQVPEEHLTKISDGESLENNPESRVKILFLEDSIERIICAVPKLYTNKEWAYVTLNVTIRNSIPPEIPSEGTLRDFRIGEADQSLTCQVEGFPRPEIMWTFQDKEIQEPLVVVDKVISKVLIFPQYVASMEGDYKCTASNIKGNQSQVFQVRTFKDRGAATRTLLYTLPPLGLFILLLASIGAGFYYRRKARLEKYREIKEIERLLRGDSKEEYNENGELVSNPLWAFYDESIDMDKSQFRVDLDAQIGKGEYGEVYKGTLDGIVGYVAFKTLAKGAPTSHLKMLVSELKIMMYIGPHENVVELLGAYRKEIRSGIFYVATEYCGLGSMEEYLRSCKPLFIKGLIFGEDNEPNSNIHPRSGGIHTYQQLLIWCAQIANAMEYLNSKRVIHFDLATRNVLLTADAIAKVTDFGLSRRTYNYTEYVKKGDEKLPWQSLALEAIKTNTYSVETDVWAYGITLWEIFSFGDVPYGGGFWLAMNFVQQLEAGHRNSKPAHATDEIYALMLQCWDADPKKRPTFGSLKDSFEKMLKNWHSITLQMCEARSPVIQPLTTGYVQVDPTILNYMGDK